MNWYIGQEIVCVKTHSMGLVIRGKTYIINGLSKPPCNCNYLMIEVGLKFNPEYNSFAECPLCIGVFYMGHHFCFHESLFAPLDQDISELTEILENSKPYTL